MLDYSKKYTVFKFNLAWVTSSKYQGKNYEYS